MKKTALKVVKAKKGFLEGYRKYNPSVSGYGNPDKWRAAFAERMGYGQATEFLRGKDESVIPFAAAMKSAKSLDVLKRIFRDAMRKHHPDRFGANVTDEIKTTAQSIVALFTVLEKKFEERNAS